MRSYLHVCLALSIFSSIILGQGSLDSGLVAFYPFNGNANDESINENHGIVFGATLTNDRFGNPNSAYEVNGIDNFIQIPYSTDFDFSSTHQLSWGCWVNLDTLRYQDNVPLSKDAACFNFAFAIDIYSDGRVETGIHAGDCWALAISDETLDLQNWHHLFATADDFHFRQFINGEEMMEIPLTAGRWDAIYEGDLYIGAFGGVNPLDQFFNGIIDEVRIYRRVLTANEIDSLYNEGDWVGLKVSDGIVNIPTIYIFSQNYPNPFNPVSTIRYDLPQASNVLLIVYDILGREVARLVDGYMEPGYHQTQWNGRGKDSRELPSGIYIARLVTPEYTKSIKMVLLK